MRDLPQAKLTEMREESKTLYSTVERLKIEKEDPGELGVGKGFAAPHRRQHHQQVTALSCGLWVKELIHASPRSQASYIAPCGQRNCERSFYLCRSWSVPTKTLQVDCQPRAHDRQAARDTATSPPHCERVSVQRLTCPLYVRDPLQFVLCPSRG